MSALPNPAPSDNSRDIISKFRHEYGAALDDARKMVVLTETEGWRALYRGHQDATREKRRTIGKQLTVLATKLEDHGWSDDDEKAVKDLVKSSAENSAADVAFHDQTVKPVEDSVIACSRIADRFLNQATREERDAPMVNIGLEALMRTEIGKMPKPVWDAENGIVSIKYPLS